MNEMRKFKMSADFFLQIHPIIFVGVQECKVLLYIGQGIPIVTLYSYLSILVGKISTVFLQNLEYLLTDQG